MDVTNLVRSSLKVTDPDVARLQDGVLQGRAVGSTTVQVRNECVILAAEVVYRRTVFCILNEIVFVAGSVSRDVIRPG